ncbi:MAG: hypothetical protein IT201_11245 [Thermoleophilia bacterium]|nr:hypothetical protein [Thermoleophilia bacterium]
MRRVLIVNPGASAVTPALVERVRAELASAAPVEVRLTERPGHATELAAACADCAAVYVLAGDGGYNEVVNGLPPEVPIGFVPGGATSVLPRALGLPRDPIACARRLAPAERERVISLGRANGRRFTFAAGVGLDAEIVRAIDRRGRRDGVRPGNLAFVAELGRLLAARRFRLEPVLELAGVGRAAFAIATNCDPYTYAGPLPVRATPLARFELGLDVVAPGRLGPAGLAGLAWRSLARPGQGDSEAVRYLHDVDRVELACDRPLPLQLDGEDVGDVTAVSLEAERGALRVLV